MADEDLPVSFDCRWEGQLNTSLFNQENKWLNTEDGYAAAVWGSYSEELEGKSVFYFRAIYAKRRK